MHPNLIDHLTAFIAVAETSSFSEAARRLGRAVSTISYSVTRLEESCGLQLLTRGVSRPSLTPNGRALFREAQAAVEGARRFSAHSKALERGEENRIRLAMDVLFPVTPLVTALNAFGAEHPHVQVQIFASSLNRLWNDLKSGTLDLCLAPIRDVPPDVERQALVAIELILVAVPHHPLARLKEPFTLVELSRHRQLYYVGSPSVDTERMSRVFGTDVWTVSDLLILRQLILSGVGWSFGTEAFFAEDLACGRVVRLDCSDLRIDARWTFGAMWHIDQPPGPLGQKLLEMVRRATGPAPDGTGAFPAG